MASFFLKITLSRGVEVPPGPAWRRSRAPGFLGVCRHRSRVSPMNGFGEGIRRFEKGLGGGHSFPALTSTGRSDDAIVLLLPPASYVRLIHRDITQRRRAEGHGESDAGGRGRVRGRIHLGLPGVSLMGEGDGKRRKWGLFLNI